jgi:hypothetical protein
MADKLLFLTWRKLALFVGAWVLAVVLHNAIYALFHDPGQAGSGVEEPFFFLLAVVVIPAWFLVALLYTCFRRFARRGEHRHGAH